MIFFDTETCGLHGLPVLLQYAEDDGEIQLWNFWTNQAVDSMYLIQKLVDSEVVGFNLTFDWFHLCKMWNTLSFLKDKTCYPEDVIDEMAECELKSRDGLCLKPKGAFDLFLYARKTKYQNLMERRDIWIRRVPSILADQLAMELEARVPLDPIFFSRKKKHLSNWSVEETDDIDFRNLVLRFAPSMKLKVLAQHALGYKDVRMFKDIEVDRKFMPVELGYAPFAKLVGAGAWPEVIQHHIDHWEYHSDARKYAKDDIVYTRDLYKFFECPPLNDNDSILACSVAANRLRGFAIDIDKLKKLRTEKLAAVAKVPTAPNRVKAYIWPDLTPEEAAVTHSTKKVVLQALSESTDICTDCDGQGCVKCNDTGEVPTKAAIKAAQVLQKRIALKEIELFDKLIKAGRFHASFKVIGALSSRMSGTDKLNPQGIKAVKEVRECFPLAFGEMGLSKGDFEAFEVTIAVAAFNDPDLEKDLRAGKVIHALFAEELFPDATYDEIVASKKTDFDMYTKGKQGVFSQIYGGNENTLMNRLGITKEVAEQAAESWRRRYRGIATFQKSIFEKFCSMRQPNGIGSKIFWNEPAEYIESLNGFPRFFTLENNICRALFNLAENPPPAWTNLKLKVQRRDRLQTAAGAVRSAVFAAAFGIQSGNMRAAMNHVIQSTGAIITKDLQTRLWALQPQGIHRYMIQLLNIHDELLCPSHPTLFEPIKKVVNDSLVDYAKTVPLISIDWETGVKSWAS